MQSREASPVLWRSGEKDYVLCAGTRRVFCLDLVTGTIVRGAPSGVSASTPAVAGDVMVLSGGRKNLGLVAYRLWPREATLLWNVPFVDQFTSAVICGKYVSAVGGGSGVMEFGVKGRGCALCVELETGKTAWTETIGEAQFSSPVVADGKMLFEVGPWLYLIQATPDGCQLLEKADLKLPLWITPTIADGRLYVRTPHNVACYDLRAQP